jgi:hypothetical protein
LHEASPVVTCVIAATTQLVEEEEEKTVGGGSVAGFFREPGHGIVVDGAASTIIAGSRSRLGPGTAVSGANRVTIIAGSRRGLGPGAAFSGADERTIIAEFRRELGCGSSSRAAGGGFGQLGGGLGGHPAVEAGGGTGGLVTSG